MDELYLVFEEKSNSLKRKKKKSVFMGLYKCNKTYFRQAAWISTCGKWGETVDNVDKLVYKWKNNRFYTQFRCGKVECPVDKIVKREWGEQLFAEIFGYFDRMFWKRKKGNCQKKEFRKKRTGERKIQKMFIDLSEILYECLLYFMCKQCYNVLV